MLSTAQESYYGGYTPSATTKPTAAKISGGRNASVNLTTGAVQKHIPIYTIEQNGMSWSTGLQYNYAGLRVMEEPSAIGLGWNLTATGMVSREVRGLPDDHPKGYHGSENIREQLHLDDYYDFSPLGSSVSSPIGVFPETGNKKVLKEHHAYLLAQGLADGEPDLFRVSAGNLNFAFKLGENLEPVLLSHHNVKVTFSWNQIEVVDSEGVLYIFSAKEVFTPIPEDDIFKPGPNGEQILLPIEPNYPFTRSWYLTSIQPPNTTQQITFSYDNHLFQTKAFLPKIYSYKGLQSEFLVDLLTKQPDIVPIGQQPDVELEEGQDPTVYTHTRLDVNITKPVLRNIQFAEGSLEFNTKTVPSGAHHQYDEILLKDFNNKLINTYALTTSGNRRLLNDLKINGETTYSFDYYLQNNNNTIPNFSYKQNEVYDQMDYWGFYTGRTSIEDVLQSQEGHSPVFDATLAGALQRIHYKSGGYSEIKYEPNILPRTINYMPDIPSSYNYSHDIELASVGGNSSGSSQKKSITRTFDTAIPITIAHRAVKTTAEGALKILIRKHGGNPSTTPYYDQDQNSFSPYLDLDIKASLDTDGPSFPSFFTQKSKTFTIQPGTYTFYLETSTGTEASIELIYGQQPKYRKEVFDRPYGGIRVSSIQSTAQDTGEHTTKAYSYTTDVYQSSSKVYSVLKELPREKDVNNEIRTDLINLDYPFYVENRGVPIYYSQVSESIRSSKDGSENGRTVYNFEEPYFFTSELDYRTKEYYDRMPKGQMESGIRLGSTRVYKYNKDKSLVNREELISEKNYEYQEVTLETDDYGNAMDANYPYGIKVISKSGLKREMHYPDWMVRLKQLGQISNIPDILLEDFDYKYTQGTQEEFEQYVNSLLSATGANGGSPVGSYIKYMGVGVSNIEVETLPGWQLTSGFSEEVKHEFYTTLEYKETNVQYLRSKVTTKTYSDTNPDEFSITEQTFKYDDNNQLVEQHTTDSKGETNKVAYFYPYHPSVDNTKLINGNRISAPVRTETYYKDQKQSTALVNFKEWDTDRCLPQSLQAAKADTPLLDQTIFYGYDDYGNPLETSAREGIRTIYVWGYNYTTPIAVITNASYTGMPSAVQSLINTAIAASDNDTDATSENQLRTALQNLRNHNYFASSQMVTYTYDPLIGMTSTTDVRNRTAYYEYDSLHRLKQVKDQDGNILSANEYNYKNN